MTFGRVPFAYYIAHLYLIHALAVVYAWASIGEPPACSANSRR